MLAFGRAPDAAMADLSLTPARCCCGRMTIFSRRWGGGFRRHSRPDRRLGNRRSRIAGRATDCGAFGVAGAGAVGSVAPGAAAALTGVAGTAAVGTLAPGTSLSLSGVEGTGAVAAWRRRWRWRLRALKVLRRLVALASAAISRWR